MLPDAEDEKQEGLSRCTVSRVTATALSLLATVPHVQIAAATAASRAALTSHHPGDSEMSYRHLHVKVGSRAYLRARLCPSWGPRAVLFP